MAKYPVPDRFRPIKTLQGQHSCSEIGDQGEAGKGGFDIKQITVGLGLVQGAPPHPRVCIKMKYFILQLVLKYNIFNTTERD